MYTLYMCKDLFTQKDVLQVEKKYISIFCKDKCRCTDRRQQESLIIISFLHLGISVEGVQEKAYERLPELLPKNTPMSVKVVSHNEEDGTYVIDVPSVVNSLVSEGLVCRDSQFVFLAFLFSFFLNVFAFNSFGLSLISFLLIL